MKKSKIGVFAVLGVLAITGVGVGVLSTQSLETLVNATVNANCALTWDKNNVPTIATDGTGTSVAGHTELAYTGAVGVADHHVGLKAGGTITQSNRAWDGTIGGKINGLEEITVWYTNNIPAVKTENPDYDPFAESPMDPGYFEFIDSSASLKLRTYHNGEMSKSNTSVVSGVPIDLRQEEIVANEFILQASVSGDQAALTGTIDIQKIEIKCTMDTSYVITHEGAKRGEIEYYTVDADGNRGTKIGRTDLNFREGMQFAFKHKETITDAKLTATDFVITGNVGAVKEKLLPDETKTTYFVTFGKSNININFKSTTALAPYAGKAFVGTYKLVNPKTMTTVDLVIDDKGEYTFGSICSGTYTLGADDMPVFTDSDGKSYTNVEGLRFIDENFAVFTYQPNSSSKIYYYGGRGEGAVTVTEHRHNTNDDYGYHATITANGAQLDVLTCDKDTFILDSSFVVRDATVEDGIGSTDIMMIQETHPTAEGATFALSNTKTLKAYTSTVAENTIMTAYMRVKANNRFTDVKIDDRIYGEYTCAGKDTIKLDGFGGYIMGAKSGKYDEFGWTTNIVTIGGVEYQLDKSNNTYKEVVKIVNFLADGETRTYKSADGLIDVTFAGNTVKDNLLKASKTYEFDEIKGEIKISLEANGNFSGNGRNYTFVIGETPDTITVTRAQKYTTYYEDEYWGWQSNNDEEDICVTPCVIALQKEEPNPFATKVTYSNGSKSFVFENGTVMVNDGSSWDKPTRAEKFTYDGTKVTFSKFYHESDPYGDSMSALYSQSVTFTFTLSADFTTLTLDADIVLDPIDAMAAKTLYSAGFTLTKVA